MEGKNNMYTKQSKNTLILNILSILEKYTDKNHRLNQQEIVELLKSEYNMVVDRKSITRNIDNLLESDYEIDCDESDRGKGKKKNTIRTNFYIERDFDDSELRFLIDGIIFSRLISQNQKRGLIKKLENLSNRYFKTSMRKIETANNDGDKNEDLFFNIEIIAEAIEKKRKIKFNYYTYDINKKLIPRIDNDGNDKVYVANPYQMVATNGRYYLVCTTNEYSDVSNLRVDRITNIEILDEKAEYSGVLKDYDIPKHMVEHIYMMSGESEIVTFRFNSKILKDVIDWFGNDISLKEIKNKDIIDATVKVNVNAMKFWAMQYGENVTITSPKKLVSSIKSQLEDMRKRYK